MLLLLIRSPDKDTGTAQPSAAVVVGRHGQVVPVHFLVDYDGVVDSQTASAILGRRGRPEPTLLAQLAAELAILKVLIVGYVFGVGRMRQVLGNVLIQPVPHLCPELFLLRGILRLEVHNGLL